MNPGFVEDTEEKMPGQPSPESGIGEISIEGIGLGFIRDLPRDRAVYGLLVRGDTNRRTSPLAQSYMHA